MRRSMLMVGASLVVALMGGSQALAQNNPPAYNAGAAFTGQTNLNGRHVACVWAQPSDGDYSLTGVGPDIIGGNAQACLQGVTLFGTNGAPLTNANGSSSSGVAGQLSQGSVSATSPTYTSGTVNAISLDTSGNTRVALTVGSQALAAAPTNAAISATATSNSLRVVSFGFCFDGTTWVQGPSCATSNSAQAVARASNTATTGLVAKASAGNYYTSTVTNGATAGLFIVYNATAVPADGALTASLVLDCFYVAANTTVKSTNAVPVNGSAGVVGFLSSATTNCATKTGISPLWQAIDYK